MRQFIRKPVPLIGLGLLAAFAATGLAADKKYTIATVVKISGINWFNHMETGVKKFATDTGNTTEQLGPPTTDSAQQNQIVEDLIAKKVDAICVVPFQPPAMEPVLKKALASDGVPDDAAPDSACQMPIWQKNPAQVTFAPLGGAKQTFAIRGHVVDLVNDAEDEDEGTK